MKSPLRKAKRMRKRPIEPLLWGLFSTGGMVSAVLFPVHVFLFGLAFPLGWFEPAAHGRVLALVSHPLGKLYLFVFCSLPLFHWAHRFKYTLYDGLQIKHLNELINTLCYGGAVAGTLAAAYLLWQVG